MNCIQRRAQLRCARILLVATFYLLITGAYAGVRPDIIQLGGAASGSSTPNNHLPDFGSGVGAMQTNLPVSFAGGNVNNIVGADTFYANGITGQGTKTANVEAGHIWSGHETLAHVSQYSHDAGAWDDPGTVGNQTSDLFDRHATWVGMTIGGRNGGSTQGTYQTGIAPNTDLKSGAIASAWSGNAFATSFNFSGNSFTTPYAAYFGTADVINSSWGGTDTRGISGFAVALDQFPSSTFVVSAGNSADPDNNPNTLPVTNTVGAPGSGYNAITVGALQNNGSNVYNAVADFSSRGPQDFGWTDSNGNIFGCNACRAAVDIASPGTNLTAAYYGGATGGNNPSLAGSPSGVAGGPNFYSLSVAGTSFASPIVAGGAALLDSASYNTPALAGNAASRDARVIKAVLLNSADKIPGWTNGQVAHPNGNGGVQTFQSLDYNSGAGALDLTKGYSQYVTAGTRDVPGTPSGNQGPVSPVGWDFGQVVSGIDNIYPINQPLLGGSFLTVTLDWFRERTFNVAQQTISEVGQADLDLSIRDMATGNLISESFSGVNNTEHLYFPLPRTSTYQIEVRFFGTIFDFSGALTSEQYGLAWSATAVPEPTSVALLAISLVVFVGRKQRRPR